MARTTNQDAGKYNYPASIQAPAPWSDNGQGGNANANAWVTVRSPMIALLAGRNGRGASLTYKYGQLYPDAHHYAIMRYADDVPIRPGMSLLVNNRRFRILAAIDEDLRQVETIMPVVEELAKGSE